MDSQDQHNQPGPGYHDLPPGQETPADQQPDAVQSKAEQQQQDLPQPQPHWQTNQPYQPYAFGFQHQPQQQQQPAGAANQYQNYGMQSHFQHMSYGGYNFPPPPSQHGYPIASAAPHLRDGSQPPESQSEQLQHDQGQQFQPVAPQDFQQNPPQQFQQVPDPQQGQPQQFLQGAPQQVQHGNHQYGAPHYPGFPPQQYPYWSHPGPMTGYPPQIFNGPMMQSNNHELTPDPALKASTPHRGHSDSPAALPDQAVQQHGTYPMPPMMSGFPYPGPAHPYYNHPAPSMPPAVPPAAQPTPEPPKPVPSPSPLAASDHTSPLHDPTSGQSRSPTLLPPHHQPQPPATPPPAPTTTTAQPPAPPSSNEDTTNASRTAALRLLHATTTPTTPPPPYGPGATDPAYACSPETARLHRQAPGASVHAVRHTRDCGSCGKGGGRRAGRKRGKKGGCDRLWPCGACVEKDGRWGGCRYVMTEDDGAGDGDGDEGRADGCGLVHGGADGEVLGKAAGLPATGLPAQDAGAADVQMTDTTASRPETQETQENVAAPLDPALDAASTPAAGLVSVQLPPDVLQQLLGNPQVLAALRESGYAGDEQALGGAVAAVPRTPLGQEQRSSPPGGQQDSSPQDERTVGSDGPMTLAQLAAVRRGEGEEEG
ncbi:uncharacterized protein LTHEOB_142 [Neofusicoccum parvum]|uniref:Uncharacterized protein LTHEOB_142 n=1 Tax=Neofusicoccum parvum TaxID=310453 RepID=A0ACB5SDH5_9PEZI|nr:uncharacterized protein LTHEOB_142 [Neofusicoccum parvum]